MQFRALKDFFSDETRSLYTKGMTYTVRPGNDKLAALVPQWVKEGLVETGGSFTGTGVSGVAKVA